MSTSVGATSSTSANVTLYRARLISCPTKDDLRYQGNPNIHSSSQACYNQCFPSLYQLTMLISCRQRTRCNNMDHT
eukprot:3195272-Amphidinium_carterae.1